MKTLSILVLTAAAAFAQPAPPTSLPRIVYTKSFPKSIPDFIEITLDKTGVLIYKEALDDPNPIDLRIPDDAVSNVFALAEKLDRFSRPLESNLKVAFMGEKTFRWEDEQGKPSAAKFNYSTDLDAQALLDWFEKVAESERAFIELERTVKFDKLGVQDAVLRIEVMRDSGRLIASEQFLKLLDRVVKSQTYMNIARERSEALAASFRLAKPEAAKP